MCETVSTGKKAQNVWNGWLEERDLAPGEVVSQWLQEKTSEGLAIASEYAQAGFDRALARDQGT
ncbi:unnamed protein product [Polarella glacialis]|uniref:Uncharacterized protein n=1 Tax=Polarella glacialis TaxID=89957 RepID=A0A813LNA0_POLGL|nr:unnamed protein product [Polarella glacialis]